VHRFFFGLRFRLKEGPNRVELSPDWAYSAGTTAHCPNLLTNESIDK
jgi:hypothetical protein